MAIRPSLRLIGERGPEAVVPLHRLPEVARGGGGAPTVNVAINGTGVHPEAIVREAELRVARSLRESSWYRTEIKRQARQGL